MTTFLDVDDVLVLHQIRLPGGLALDLAKLDGALNRPRNLELYDETATIHTMAGVLFEGIIQAHAFEDGNKRTAVLAVATFYALNGYEFVRASDTELVHLAVDIATGDVDAQKAADMFELWADERPESED